MPILMHLIIKSVYISLLFSEAQSKQRKRRSSRVSVRYVKQLQDGEEIYSQLQSSSDPDSFMV